MRSDFAGDSNEILWGVQDEARASMVAHLYSTARQRYLKASVLVAVKTELCVALRDNLTCEHRTLRTAHDLIAAYYRFKVDRGPQLKLDENLDGYEHRLRHSWSDFFQGEVDQLLESDKFTRAVLAAAVFPGTESGEHAAEQLRLDLEERYWEMRKG